MSQLRGAQATSGEFDHYEEVPAAITQAIVEGRK